MNEQIRTAYDVYGIPFNKDNFIYKKYTRFAFPSTTETTTTYICMIDEYRSVHYDICSEKDRQQKLINCDCYYSKKEILEREDSNEEEFLEGYKQCDFNKFLTKNSDSLLYIQKNLYTGIYFNNYLQSKI